MSWQILENVQIVSNVTQSQFFEPKIAFKKQLKLNVRISKTFLCEEVFILSY